MHCMLIIKYSWFPKIVFLDLLLKIPGSIGAIRSLARAGQFKAHFKRLFLRRMAEFNSALELNATHTPQKKKKKIGGYSASEANFGIKELQGRNLMKANPLEKSAYGEKRNICYFYIIKPERSRHSQETYCLLVFE